jgi:hypothetical protein
MVKQTKRLYRKYKSHAISWGSILALIGGLTDLYNENHKQKDTQTLIWSHINEKEQEIQKANSEINNLKVQMAVLQDQLKHKKDK